MNIILDTCLVIRNDEGQSKVPHFDYGLLERLLSDSSSTIFISPFSIPELYCLRHYTNSDDLVVDLAKETIGIINYDFSRLKQDFSKYGFIDKYSAVMFYHLTEFLDFFVLEVLFSLKLDKDITALNSVIRNCTEEFYNNYGKTFFENCTTFMKEGAIEYIISCISSVLIIYNYNHNTTDIWKLISQTKLNTGIPFQSVCNAYFRYARFLIDLFREKLSNGASRIKLEFGFNDLLIAYASDFQYVVLSSDKKMCEYLLKYGNNQNKQIIQQLWDVSLTPMNS